MRIVVIGAMLAGLACGAQAAPKPAAYHPAPNAYGQPDLEGVWSFNSMTRLERPPGVVKLVMSEDEARRTIPPGILPNDQVGTSETEAYDAFNLDWARLGGEIRSSWLLEPADGRLPYRPDAAAKVRAPSSNDNPEGRSVYERCLYMPQGGPPMLNAAYNNNLQFLQTRDTVAIQLEANHEVRIVRLTGRHAPAAMTQWFGDSVGWYEGQTLVVETVGFSPGQSDRRSAMTRVYMSPKAKVTERFTRISARQIRYEFTVEDPAVFTQAWRGEIPLTFTTEPTFEYACHEGNYGLANILSGAREEEKRAAEGARR
ncbi:MAG: hypothetical protein JWO33_5 [Caulobacteraceae bacterium]|nr:hypothetical protein [Caulobacteraceae bacterium]